MNDTRESDRIQAARRGDTDALQNLVESHYGIVFRYVLTAVAYDQEAAADITQEAFVGAVSGINRFRGDSSFLTWVVGIATNHIRGAQRKGRIRETSIDDVPEENLRASLADNRNPESGELIGALVRRLPMGQRQALYLREFLGYTYDEVAVTLGIGVGAAKNRVLEARRNMVKAAQMTMPDAFEDLRPRKHVNARR